MAAARAAGSCTFAGAANLIAAWSAEFIRIAGGATARLTLIGQARSMASSASQAGFWIDRRGKRGTRAAQVSGHGGRAEDGSRHPVAIEKGEDDQHEPDRRARQQ